MMGSKQLENNSGTGESNAYLVGKAENDLDPIKTIETVDDKIEYLMGMVSDHNVDLLKICDKLDEIEMHLKQLAYLVKKR